MPVKVILQKRLYNPTKAGFGGAFPFRKRPSCFQVESRPASSRSPAEREQKQLHVLQHPMSDTPQEAALCSLTCAGGSSRMPSATRDSGRPPGSQMPCTRGHQRTGAVTRKTPPATFSPWAVSRGTTTGLEKRETAPRADLCGQTEVTRWVLPVCASPG